LEATFWGASMRQKKLELLRDEVLQGKCNIGIVDGEVVRTVCVVALQLRCSVSCEDDADASGKFLVQLGELRREGNAIKHSCVLPATKRAGREGTEGAVQRVLDTDFDQIKQHIVLCYDEGLVQTSFMKDSPSYGIRTRYLRTTVKADLVSTASLRLLHHHTASSLCWNGSSVRVKQQRCGLMCGFQQKRNQARATALLRTQCSALIISCPSDKKCAARIYLWLSESEFQTLSHEFAEPVIQQWVASIDACDIAD